LRLWAEIERAAATSAVNMSITLTDPIDMKEYFKAQVTTDHFWNGVDDQNSWYPLMNAFFDYLDERNSVHGQID